MIPAREVGNGHHWITADEVKTVARLINYCVDLDHFTEEEEQEIFEHTVEEVIDKISHILPRPYARLVLNDTKEGIDDKLAHDLSVRLTKHVRSEVLLPYLDHDDEKMVVQCVVALVVESMKSAHRIEDVCQPENAAEVIVDVFMKVLL